MNPTVAIFNPPTTNVDGAPLDPTQIAKYRVAVGILAADGAAQTYPTTFDDLAVTPAADGSVSVPITVLGDLAPASYVGVVYTVTSGGVLSAPSDPASFAITSDAVKPNPPQGLRFA